MKSLRILAIAALTAALTGCMHNVPVSYLEAAKINVDHDIHTILVIDRSRAHGFEHILNAAEGAATGETYHLDADSAAIAIEALEDVLEDGQRFEVINFHVDGRAVDTSMWDRALTARKVRELCRRAKCDAVIALDSFDSDMFTEVEQTVDRSTRDVDYKASQSTDVVATFRMYDGDTGRVVDERRIQRSYDDDTSKKDSARKASENLPYEAAVFAGAASIGHSYGTRISPHTVVDTRAIYTTGSKQMRRAVKAVRHHDMRSAVRIWQTVAKSNDSKLAAKALYNIAVSAEANGNLKRATRLANKASQMGGKKRMHQYVAILNARHDNDIRLDRQLGTTVASN